MRKPDNTIVFGSQNGPVSTTMQGPSSLRGESQWFASNTVTERRPVSEDLIPERTIARSDRGLAFAAISLALIGVAAAGTYFLLGINTPVAAGVSPVATTTITQADIPAPQPAAAPAPAPTPVVMPANLPWDKPVVDAVKAPGLKQVLPAPRPQAAKQAPAPTTTAPAATVDSDDALERAGFPKRVAPAPSPEPYVPSAASSIETTHMEPTQPTPAPSDVLPDVGLKQ